MPVPALIEALRSPDAYPHPAAEVRLIETHISWVLLAGRFAYKIKKPLDLGFLDFSTLDKRRFCCEEEIRLNRRLAPHIYLEVVPVAGSEMAPRIKGDGPVLEWAVRMRAFPADSTLDREPEVTAKQIDAIADRVAGFHKTIAVAPADSAYGTPAMVMQPVRENFAQLRGLLQGRDDDLNRIEALSRWSETEGTRLNGHFRRRKQDGYVRECHGDLHLGNIAWVDEAPLIFDCIEFNPDLRHIDIVSEAAFLCMDLIERGHTALAWRFLNRWLEHTGDYAGLDGLRFYLVYRAMVRAKVSAIRGGQGDAEALAECTRYLDLADTLSRRPVPRLFLMHGHSGSGKTWTAQHMLEALGAIRLRSDVERKRLFGLEALADSSTVPGGIYGQETNQRTLDRLLELAGKVLEVGYTVIVDATFLACSWRRPFFELARRRGWPVCIISMQSDADLMRRRISERMRLGSDASEAGPEVLEAQLQNAEPLTEEELKCGYPFYPEQPGALTQLIQFCSDLS